MKREEGERERERMRQGEGGREREEGQKQGIIYKSARDRARAKGRKTFI